MMLRLLNISVTLLFFVTVSISQQQPDSFYDLDFEWNFEMNPENVDHIELNILAVKLLNESERQFNSFKEDSLLEVAKEILTKIVNEKKYFYKAHINLATILIRQKNYDEAETVLKNLLGIIEYPTCVFYLGILLEKKNEIDQATEKYKRALFLYNEYFKTYLSGGLVDQEREMILLLLEGKEKSIKRVQEQIKSTPDDTPLLDEEFLTDFDRKKFIEDF